MKCFFLINTIEMNPKVDFYFNKDQKWQAETRLLREIVLETGLQEELKWGVPTYLYQKSNIILIHVFKEYCAILFVKGVLLDDSDNILVQQTENVQAARQMRFTSIQQVNELKIYLKNYIFEAIEVEKAGLKVQLKKPSEFKIAEEFQKELNSNNTLKAAFEKLTPGRQRAYLLHFSAPKQAKTRESRIENCIPKILNGKGLDDK